MSKNTEGSVVQVLSTKQVIVLCDDHQMHWLLLRYSDDVLLSPKHFLIPFFSREEQVKTAISHEVFWC